MLRRILDNAIHPLIGLAGYNHSKIHFRPAGHRPGIH